MKVFIHKHHRLLFYSAWIILGLVQARFTELQDDEAYYWVYSRFPAWGYFDHPPMIAMLVKWGYAIFPNELGVRLFCLLLNTGSILLIEKLVNRKNPFLFYAIVLSIGMMQAGGFMAAPDIPLLFFTALFFWAYKRFTPDPSALNTFLLGLSMSLLFYSKYQAILIVVFTLLSNPRLLARYQTWIAGLLALVLFGPHLWWQYQNNWISIRYHLFENKVTDYNISFTLNYLLGQLLMPGPLAGFILLPAAFLYRPGNAMERAMKFTLAGTYLFFLLSSFRGKVEMNWTSPAMVPLIVLSYYYLEQHDGWRKWIYRLLPVTLLLVLAARVIMLFDILPVKKIVFRFHMWKKWPQEMKRITGGNLVVLNNSYQRASKYWFYTGQTTYSLNYYQRRMNNYNFWPLEDSVLGKPVYYLDIKSPFVFNDSLKYPLGYVVYKYDSCYASYAKIQVSVQPANVVVENQKEVLLKCTFHIPQHYSDFINMHPPENDTIRIGLFSGKKFIKDVFLPFRLTQVNENPVAEFPFNPGLPKGKYFMRFAINTGIYTPTHNSDKISLVVK
jgi:hypothetical protein